MLVVHRNLFNRLYVSNCRKSGNVPDMHRSPAITHAKKSLPSQEGRDFSYLYGSLGRARTADLVINSPVNTNRKSYVLYEK